MGLFFRGPPLSWAFFSKEDLEQEIIQQLPPYTVTRVD